VVVLDPSRPRSTKMTRAVTDRHRLRVVAMNKSDLPAVWSGDAWGAMRVAVSARSGEGLDALVAAMRPALAGAGGVARCADRFQPRHVTLLEEARAALTRARAAHGGIDAGGVSAGGSPGGAGAAAGR
jgi:tRNA U34 5-carboxymethylaminomethyl modifying GTPase MnmE/TrmE